jgi:hypothetical protein
MTDGLFIAPYSAHADLQNGDGVIKKRLISVRSSRLGEVEVADINRAEPTKNNPAILQPHDLDKKPDQNLQVRH